MNVDTWTSVLAGQGLARRGDDRRRWRDLLQSAASDVALSYAQERAGLTHDRGQGEASPDIDKVTYVVDRQRALNRPRTLPGGDAFEPQIAGMGEGIEELWQAYSADDDQWHAARARLKEAIQAFTAVVRREIQR